MKLTGVMMTGVKADGRDGSGSDFKLFDVADIFKIELERPSRHTPKQPCFYTRHGRYFNTGSLEGFEYLLGKFGITHLDNVNLVNLNNIEYVEETTFFTRVYFEDGSYASVSNANKIKIANKPRKPQK